MNSFQNYLEERKNREEILDFEKQLLKVKKEVPQVAPVFSMDDVDLMTGNEFEDFVVTLFNKMGYTSFKTKASNDQGIDVVANKENYKMGTPKKEPLYDLQYCLLILL
jgi:HJR/Mrr/RecB family endonuclease